MPLRVFAPASFAGFTFEYEYGECQMQATPSAGARTSPPNSKALLFSTLSDLVEAALEGNTFRTAIILRHLESSFPSIASTCTGPEEQRVRAALALPPPHDDQACCRALESLGFSRIPPSAPPSEKRAATPASRASAVKRQRRQQAPVESKEALGDSNTPTKLLAGGVCVVAAKQPSPLTQSSPLCPATGVSRLHTFAAQTCVATAAASQLSPVAAAATQSASLSDRRPHFVDAITQKLSFFSSRAASILPQSRLLNPNDTAVNIERSLYNIYVVQRKDDGLYKRQLLRILNALECPAAVDVGLFAARVLLNEINTDDIAVMSADDMVSASAAAAAKVAREYELHMASLAPEAVELGKVVNTNVHTFWSYPKEGD
jgi:hypothetical protein